MASSSYHERRPGPNVSEFVANLNALPSPQDRSGTDAYALDDDLAMFTNTQFFDFDAGTSDLGGFGHGHSEGGATAAAGEAKDMTPLDFLQQGAWSCLHGIS